ncbi:hypothetical protein LN050_04860 [Comamonadaceae bacterium M7527]|nr:hypothetical protein LN050_04860 [Comamonadaceae bacterium M7527]
MHGTPLNIVLLDSISAISDAQAGTVVVSGSHGGSSAADFVLAASTRNVHATIPAKPVLVVLNDAGVGKDQAGIAALAMLQAHGIACACYSHNSARIGEAQDALDNGVISALNETASDLGLSSGQTVLAAVKALS